MKNRKSLEKRVYIGAISIVILTTMICLITIFSFRNVITDELTQKNITAIEVFENSVLESIEEPLILMDTYYDRVDDKSMFFNFFLEYFNYFKMSDRTFEGNADLEWEQYYVHNETTNSIFFRKSFKEDELILEYPISEHELIFVDNQNAYYSILNHEGVPLTDDHHYVNMAPHPDFEKFRSIEANEVVRVDENYIIKTPHIGWYVLMNAHTVPLQQKTQKLILVILSIWLSISTIIMLLTAYIIKLIKKDVSVINSHTEQIGQGQYILANHPIHYEEISNLDSKIREMAELLLERTNEITEINLNLESIVEDRASEIIRVNKALEVEIEEKEVVEGEIRKINKGLDDKVKLRTKELESLNSELSRSIELANEANESKGKFLAVMSHEMRTPLNGVIGFAHMLSLELKDSEYKSTIDMILNSSKVLLALINDVLDFAKYESGKMTFESVKFNLRDELEEVLDTFALLINEKNLLFKCLNLDTINYIVLGDPTKIKQIFFNLLNNALKFTNEGGITIHFDSEIISKDLKLSVEITDTGIGMAKASQKHLFEPFKQGHDLIHKEFGGTGLGLSITKEIIEHMKGKVVFESILMAGTTCYFDIILPISDEHGKIEDTVIEPIVFNKVLYVEDNIVNQKLMQQYFKKYRIPFDVAFDGKEAVSKFSRGQYDLIFMDLQMPIMDGYEATELIKQMDESVYIIAMTAYTSNEVRDKCRLVGMNDYISKPVDFNYLAALLDIKDVHRKNLISSEELMTEHATVLSQMIDFDVEVCLELIMTFVNQLLESFVKIEGLRLKGDIESIKNIIHKMKGGSATVRLEKINHLFIKVETLISNNKYPEAFDVIDQIKEFAILK